MKNKNYCVLKKKDGVRVKILKVLGRLRISWLTKFFNKVLVEEKMPDSRRKSNVVPIFKVKGNYLEIIYK